jgi:hypothetical protein
MNEDFDNEFGYEALFNEGYISYLRDEYGKEFDIKRKCKTPCKVYEIRTAIRFWLDGQMTHRTCDAFATRLSHYERGDITVGEAMSL